MWVLGLEPGSSERAAGFLNHRAVSPAADAIFIFSFSDKEMESLRGSVTLLDPVSQQALVLVASLGAVTKSLTESNSREEWIFGSRLRGQSPSWWGRHRSGSTRQPVTPPVLHCLPPVTLCV